MIDLGPVVSRTHPNRLRTGELPGTVYAHISLIGKARAWKARSNRDERRTGSSPVVSAKCLISSIGRASVS